MLKNKKIIIVTHVFATGPAAYALRDYLKNRVRVLLFIGHPFSFAQDIRSFYQRYERDTLVKEKKAFAWKLPEVFSWFKDILYTIFWTLCSRERFDLYVGVDNLNAFVGILLRAIGKVKKVIFYTIDYVPRRFGNKILNGLYHWVDRYCVRHCNQVWNVSPIMAKGREKQGLPDNGKQIVVPMGAWFDKAKVLPLSKINKHTLVFMGHLTKKQGLPLVLESIPSIIKRIPNFKFIIIGSGPVENELKAKIRKLGLTKYVEFTGFIKDHQAIERKIAKCALAIAPYNSQLDTFTYYADPGKIKNYLAVGLPIIVTRVPWIAKEIEKRPMGIAINYDKKELADAVVKLLKDSKFYSRCRENAIEFASKLNWEKIYDEAFSKLEDY